MEKNTGSRKAPKIIYKRVTHCNDCPYFHFEHDMVDLGNGYNEEDNWYACGFTDRIIIGQEDLKMREVDGSLLDIPEWCPLEDYSLFHQAIDAIKGFEK